jgi:hypothetical protein
MPTYLNARLVRTSAAVVILSVCLGLTACHHLEAPPEYDLEATDYSGVHTKECSSPTIHALAHDIDHLERHIELYGSVAVQTPSVWGQARMTKHRQEFEDYMAQELGNFTYSIQGSSARSDQAFFQEALYLSNAAAGAAAPRRRPRGGCGGLKN